MTRTSTQSIDIECCMQLKQSREKSRDRLDHTCITKHLKHPLQINQMPEVSCLYFHCLLCDLHRPSLMFLMAAVN